MLSVLDGRWKLTPRRIALLGAVVLALAVAAMVTAVSESALDGSKPVSDGQDMPAPLDLAQAAIFQEGAHLVVKFTTYGEWSTEDLAKDGRSLCMTFFYDGATERPNAKLCVSGRNGHPYLLFTRLDKRGAAAGPVRISAIVTRPDRRSLRAQVHPGSIDLKVGDYAWQALARWTDSARCSAIEPCSDRVPDATPVRADVQLVVFPRCYGAADRDPQRFCNNRALRYSVDPPPQDAVLLPNAPCQRHEQVVPFACTFGARRGMARETIALIGDSHAAHWRGAMWVVSLAKNWRGWSLVRTGCPVTKANPVLDEPHHSRCLRWNKQLQRWFRSHREIKTVFVSQNAQGLVHPGASGDRDAAQIAGYVRAWEALPRTVKRIIVIRDVPTGTGRSLACVVGALLNRKPPGFKCAVPRDASLHRDAAVAAANTRRARRRGVRVIDLTRFMCSSRLCYPVVGGTLVRKDKAHITDAFSTSLGPYILRAYERVK